MTTAQKREVFQRARRKGDIATLAERTGYSQSMISMTLNGQRNNESIVNTAYKHVSRRKEARTN
jgi:transcriptional regulator with XRE-family HTH domain